ncbi:MAG: asparagine synthase-related protein [Candidatus Promineifilaceae bacterium]
MSGIYGIFRKDGAPVSAESMAEIRKPIAFWGRDGADEWRADCIGLGHLMLHTTPESLHERLPIVHPHRPKLVITADARLDNRASLCRTLSIPQAQHATIGDSLLILLAYERWGKTCVHHICGDFAFAIWDGEQRTLFCARDITGVRPFLYYDSSQFFVFASDIRGLLACPQIPRRLREDLIAARLQYLTVFAEKRLSYYEGIVKIPAAHTLTVSEQTAHLSQYWRPEDAPSIRLASDEAYVEQATALLEQAVASRVRSAFAIGAHVSSGLDSSSVAILAARHRSSINQPLYGYTRTPPPDSRELLPDDEQHDVDQVCQIAGITCRAETLTIENSIGQWMRDFTREPYVEMFEEQHLQRMAAEDGVRVLLSGYGGDEVFSSHGVPYFAEMAWRGHWLKLHRQISHAVNRHPTPQRLRWMRRYGRKLSYHVGRPLLSELVTHPLSRSRKDWMLPTPYIQPDFAKRHQGAVNAMRPPPRLMRFGIKADQCWWLHLGHLTYRMEHWATAGAERGLTYRYPLLDQRLLEFCLGLPANQFYQDGWPRRLIRRVLDDVLPENLLWTKTKQDPARIHTMQQITPQLLNELLRKAMTDAPHHPTLMWVDVPKLQQAIDAIPSSGIDPAGLSKIQALSVLYLNPH